MRASAATSSVRPSNSKTRPSKNFPSLRALSIVALVLCACVAGSAASEQGPSPGSKDNSRTELSVIPEARDGEGEDSSRATSSEKLASDEARTGGVDSSEEATPGGETADQKTARVPGATSSEVAGTSAEELASAETDAADPTEADERKLPSSDELESSFGKQQGQDETEDEEDARLDAEDGETDEETKRVRRSYPPYRFPRSGPLPPPPHPFYSGPPHPGSSPAASYLRPAALPPPVSDDPNDPYNRRSILRDRSQCYSGNCEFFAMCWATGGLLSGGCGGFFFSCCVRPGTYIAEHTYNSEPARIQYGPVINDPNCGRSQPYGAQRRIVGGDNAGFGVFPWQAYIRIGKSRCGGSLINRKHVVTAGHCVKRATPSMVQVTLGDYVLGQDIEPLEPQKFGVEDIKVHPKFKYTPQADRYDVAVLTLDRAVEFAPHIAPVCLPEKGEDFLGERAFSAGWGALSPGSRLRPRTLQAVDVAVINNKECEDWHKSKGITVIIYDEMVCAGWRNGGRDACQGDSGGPMMVHRYGRWYLIGLVSAGYSCAQAKQPGIYHRVSYTSDWISAVANQNRAFNRNHEDDDSADSADGGSDVGGGAGFNDDKEEYDYYK